MPDGCLTPYSALSREPLVVTPDTYIGSIWGYDANTLFLATSGDVESSGAIFQGDGRSTWTKIARIPAPVAVWGPSADVLYVATTDGIVRGDRR